MLEFSGSKASKPRPHVRVFAAAALIAVLSMVAALFTAAPAHAQAQSDEVYETCALYNVATVTGGVAAVVSARQLSDLGAPLPPGVADALDVLIDAEDGGDVPSADMLQTAFDSLIGYYGPVCDAIDICPLINSAVDADDPRSQRSADWADRLESPSPPGIGSALSLIAGKVRLEDQQIHDSIDGARDAIRQYYSGCTLAHTGSAALPVTLIGIGLAATGSAMLIVRRNLVRPER